MIYIDLCFATHSPTSLRFLGIDQVKVSIESGNRKGGEQQYKYEEVKVVDLSVFENYVTEEEKVVVGKQQVAGLIKKIKGQI